MSRTCCWQGHIDCQDEHKSESGFDAKRVTAAVKVKLSYMRLCGTGKKSKKRDELAKDLLRLLDSMSTQEYNDYLKRIR